MAQDSSRSVTRSPQLDVRDLRMVIAVAAEGSLTRAGVRLNVTQPALSRHLRALETRLGTSLFARTGMRMRPTVAGELLLKHARDVLDRIATTELDMRALQHEPRRALRIGTDCYTGYHWMPSVLARFAVRYPDIDVEIAFDAVKHPMKQLRAGTIDVALVTDGGPRTGFDITRLFTDEYIGVVAPGHRLAKRAHIEPADLAHERVLLMSHPDSSTVMQRWLKPAGVKPRLVADVQLLGAVASLAEAEFGVGFVPSWTIAPEIRAGRLVPLRLGRSGFRRTWAAVTHRSESRETWLRDFVRSLATSVPALGLQPAGSR